MTPILTDARFALEHPDVLHTPAEYRRIIAGLVAEIKRLKNLVQPDIML